ncbi:MAG: DUF885 domain-containing protein [Elusimicrobia bacterium]|nr:DUF885 domain-containing protein [Elusimicrobiota bacterium]
MRKILTSHRKYGLVAFLMMMGPGAQAAERLKAIPFQNFDELKKEYFQCAVSLNPELASSLGLKDYRSKLSNLSEDKIQKHITCLESLEQRLVAVEPSHKKLNPQDRVDLSAMFSHVRAKLRYWRDFRNYRQDIGLIIAPYDTIQMQIAQIESGSEAAAEWKAVIRRAEQIPQYLARIYAHLAEGARNNQVTDRRILEEHGIPSIEEAQNFFGSAMADEAKKTLAPGNYTRMENDLKRAGQAAQAAYAQMVDYLKIHVLPLTKESFAIGEVEYALRLKNDFGLEEKPETLYSKGLEMTSQIRQRMEALARQIDASKDLPAVIAEIRSHYPQDDQELLKAYESVTERAKNFVVTRKLFEIPQDYKLKVLETPAGMRPVVTIAMEVPPPPFDPTKKGGFMVTPSGGEKGKLARHNFAFIASVVAHEAFPGHDLQFFFFQNNPSISAVRYLLADDRGNHFASSLNAEGWGLYAEELMRQKGFFNTKEELIQLQSQLWRAWRVVVDIALHTGKMGFEEAVKTLQEQVFLPAAVAQGEVLRYTLIPTQAITYMMGRLQIEKLKENYKEIQGSNFNEAEFHKAFLGFGPVPPSLIAQIMLDEARGSVSKDQNK